MIELENFNAVTDFPGAYRVDVAIGDAELRVVAMRPRLRLFADQVHHPSDFKFRILFPGAPLADRVRITALEPMPGRAFTIDEATLWVK